MIMQPAMLRMRDDLQGRPVPRIVALLADDELGASRETGVDNAYLSAFDDIAADPRSRLIVADDGGQVAGTLQLTVLPGLSRHGMRPRGPQTAAVVRRRRASVHRTALSVGDCHNDRLGCPGSAVPA